MASYQRMYTLHTFLRYAHKFRCLPFRPVPMGVELHISKIWLLSTGYLQICASIIMLYFFKLFFFPSVTTVLTAEDYILHLLALSVYATVLGCLIWNIVYMKRICVFFNTLYQLNRVIGEYIYFCVMNTIWIYFKIFIYGPVFTVITYLSSSL